METEFLMEKGTDMPISHSQARQGRRTRRSVRLGNWGAERGGEDMGTGAAALRGALAKMGE